MEFQRPWLGRREAQLVGGRAGRGLPWGLPRTGDGGRHEERRRPFVRSKSPLLRRASFDACGVAFCRSWHHWLVHQTSQNSAARPRQALFGRWCHANRRAMRHDIGGISTVRFLWLLWFAAANAPRLPTDHAATSAGQEHVEVLDGRGPAGDQGGGGCAAVTARQGFVFFALCLLSAACSA